MGEVFLLSAPWHAWGRPTSYIYLFYVYCRCDTLASLIARSEAWLHLNCCVLVESFLKWCVNALHHYFSSMYAQRPGPVKVKPCMRQCSHFTFNPRRIYHFWRNCFILACWCLIWSLLPRTWEILSNCCVHKGPAVGLLRRVCSLDVFSVSRYLLSSYDMLKCGGSDWTSPLTNPVCSHHSPCLLYNRAGEVMLTACYELNICLSSEHICWNP